MNRYALAGRRAVVTGGAGGIGLACARRLMREGARVSLWDLERGALGVAAAELPGVHVHVVDVTDGAAVDDAMAAEAPDIVVHCAGILGPVASAVDHAPAAFRRVIDVNLTASFLVARAAAATMLRGPLETRAGRIVLMGSIQGKEGMPLAAAYSVAKAGVMALAKTMGKELATENITVNVVAPVAAETAMAKQITAERRADILARIPTGRFVELEEIASMVAWLCSPDASFSTGATFDLSGGRATY
ncbi:MAG: SDR family oxidoreductase [Alphaproteobacteria bacterium]|nr:SDR family oxidoreductase [Alphaproteobacteria bacterium]